MLGQKLKELRESRGLIQRQVAAELKVDTALISKFESNGKPISRHHLKKLSVYLGVTEDYLLTLWLADRLYGIAKNEGVGLKAMEVAIEELKTNKYR